MSTLPTGFAQLTLAFAPLFSKRVFQSVQVLLFGAILAIGKRTVTSVLRVMGLDQQAHFQTYHRVLSRAAWSPLAASWILLHLLVRAFAPHGPLISGLDDTIERRWGIRIAARGIYRDPVRSSRSHFVKVWDHSSMPVSALRRVLIRDPLAQCGTQALLCTDVDATPAFILDCFVQRWQMEMTFEEARAHLGVETQRQWSDKAIARTTPCLLGLYSIVTLLAQPLFATGQISLRRYLCAARLGIPNRRPPSPKRSHPCADGYGATNIFQPRCTSPI